jgi:hypothetical protein
VNDEASLISNIDGVECQLSAKKLNRGLSPIFRSLGQTTKVKNLPEQHDAAH